MGGKKKGNIGSAGEVIQTIEMGKRGGNPDYRDGKGFVGKVEPEPILEDVGKMEETSGRRILFQQRPDT